MQRRPKGEILSQARRKDPLSRSKFDSDAELFMYLIQCIRFGLRTVRRLNRASNILGGHYNWSVFTVVMTRKLHGIVCGLCWGSFTLEDHLRWGCIRRLVSRSCGGSARESEGREPLQWRRPFPLLQGMSEPWLHTWI